MCEARKKKLNTTEYEVWYNNHIELDECQANHQEAAGGMKVPSIVEMSQRSFEKYGIRYNNCMRDGDSKTYSGVLNAKPYGENFIINKKECPKENEQEFTRLSQ